MDTDRTAAGRGYPFHPDLTEVFYAKWTALDRFQKTRGILRTFAMALREAEKWDEIPRVGPNVFLSAPGKAGLSEAGRELVTVAETEEYEGKKPNWARGCCGGRRRATGWMTGTPRPKGRSCRRHGGWGTGRT